MQSSHRRRDRRTFEAFGLVAGSWSSQNVRGFIDQRARVRFTGMLDTAATVVGGERKAGGLATDRPLSRKAKAMDACLSHLLLRRRHTSIAFSRRGTLADRVSMSLQSGDA